MKRIVIIGHPGIGKALLSKSLAERLGFEYVDADFGLEFRIGRILPELLGKEGEKSFLDSQFEVLSSLLKKENIIVNTDSSIICSEKNRQILSKEFVVYLKVSTNVQLERLLRNPTPFLLDTDLKTFLDELHSQRDAYYEKTASLVIDGDKSTLDEHVANIFHFYTKNVDLKIPESVTLLEKDLIYYHKKTHTPVHLTEQQAICLKLLAQGKSSKEIAKAMNISYRTIENYIATIAEKLGCSSSKELIALYHDEP